VTSEGVLTVELETSKGELNPSATLPAGGKSKSAVLHDAGISGSEPLVSQFSPVQSPVVAPHNWTLLVGDNAELQFCRCRGAL
jgi:hypothetical protein